MERVEDQIVFLAYGAGVKSKALLVRFVSDRHFRQIFAPNKLVVVACWMDFIQETLDEIEWARKYCEFFGIEFFYIDREFNQKAQLIDDKVYDGIFGRQKDKMKMWTHWEKSNRCAKSLIVKPVQNFAEWYLRKQGLFSDTYALKKYVTNHGKITICVGLEKNEKNRIYKDLGQNSIYFRRIYPWMEIGWSRKRCVQFLKDVGEKVPMQSLCRGCHFSNKPQLVYLQRYYPEIIDEWQDVEENFRQYVAWSRPKETFNGVYGKRMLKDFIKFVEPEFQDMNKEQLEEHIRNNPTRIKSKP